MSQNAQRVPDYIDHMLQAIERIQRYTEAVSQSQFLTNELVQDAVIRNIEILGEAARNIEKAAPEFAAHHNTISWSAIYAMRNRVSHGYFGVDLDLVWKTIGIDIPVLAEQLEMIRAELRAERKGP